MAPISELQSSMPREAVSPAQLRRLFFDLYQDCPKPLRYLSSVRPYVCPYDKLASFVPAGASVLDVGCGSGSLLAMLAALGLIEGGTGCDVSAPALDVARSAARRLDAGAALTFLHVAGLQEAPPGPFDVVAMVDVLHHVPTPGRQAVVAEAVRRVAENGVFIYKDMTTRSRWRRLAHNLDDYLFTREWVEQVPQGAVEAWARAGGLVLEHSEYIPRLVYGHELLVFRRPAHVAAA